VAVVFREEGTLDKGLKREFAEWVLVGPAEGFFAVNGFGFELAGETVVEGDGFGHC